jgi:hypothetical protein
LPAALEAIRADLPAGTAIELWWHDEARTGQKNKITRRWARRGTRPSAPHDQRTAWAYLFGAICPAKGKGAGLVLPYCDTEAMAAQLQERSGLGFLDRLDEWSFCLTAARMAAAQERR